MANRCYQLSIQGVLGSSYRETDLHFQSGGTSDSDTFAGGNSLLNAWDASLRTAFLATVPSSFFLVRLTARRVDLKPSVTTCKYYGVGSNPGTRLANSTGQQTSPSVFLIPTMGVKSGGKIFWPAIGQADLVNNVPSATWRTNVDAFLSTAVGGIVSAGITWTLCIFSRKNHTMSNVSGHTYSPLVGFQGKRRKPIGAV